MIRVPAILRTSAFAAFTATVGCAGAASDTLAPVQAATAHPFHARTTNVRGEVYEEFRGTV